VFDTKNHDAIMVINVGDIDPANGAQHRAMAGNRTSGDIKLYPGAVPGDGHAWQFLPVGDGKIMIVNLGDPNAGPNLYLAGNRANGEIRLYPGPVPGNGHLWRVYDAGSGNITIENVGDIDPANGAKYRFMAGNRASGEIHLYPGSVPGNGHLWHTQ
jgi:hypothetical protein